MIQGMHGMFYTSEPVALREFLRDKMGIAGNDIGEGWLIFDFAQADLGCHPTGEHPESPPSGTHDISFFTRDLEATVAELKGRGVEFLDEITDLGYGYAIHLEMPGGVRTQIYQPKYTKPGS